MATKLTKKTIVTLSQEAGQHWTECNAALEAHGYKPLTEAQAAKAGFTVAPANLTVADIMDEAPAAPPAAPVDIPLAPGNGPVNLPPARDAHVVAAIKHIVHGTAANFKALADEATRATYRQHKDAGDKLGAYRFMFDSLFDSLYVATAHLESESQAQEFITKTDKNKLGFTTVLHGLVALLEKINVAAHAEYKNRKAAGTPEAKRLGYMYAVEWLVAYAYTEAK